MKRIVGSGMSRAIRGIAIASVLAVVVAAPAAAAAGTPPTRTVTITSGFTAKAGEACAFPVAGVPTSGFVATTTFSDTRSMRSFRIKGYYENLDTGKRYWVNDSWSELDVYDPATNIEVFTSSGLVDLLFWVGDVGPFGSVMTEFHLYRFEGTTVNTVDFNVNQTTAFTWSGRLIDICAALS